MSSASEEEATEEVEPAEGVESTMMQATTTRREDKPVTTLKKRGERWMKENLL